MTPLTRKPELGTRQKIEAVICKVIGFVFLGLIVLVLASVLAPWLLAACFLWPTVVLGIVLALAWAFDHNSFRWHDQLEREREELEKFHGRR
jgi:hypothetical protein